jgi:hypothetical protein
MKKHKHSELIKLWADGAAIQYRHFIYGDWRDCISNDPSWAPQTEYRVRPGSAEDKNENLG